MIRLLIAIACGIGAVACNNPYVYNEYEMYELKSYIPYYEDGELELTVENAAWENGKATLFCWLSGSPQRDYLFAAPEVGGKGESAERFLEIALRNGDRSYDETVSDIIAWNRRCYAPNFSEVRVVCRDRAWDEEHAAGVSLNDIAEIHFSSFAKFVRNGYTGSMAIEEITKRLTDLQPDDMSMVCDWYRDLYIGFDHHPTQGKYRVEVTFVTTEGEEKTATGIFDFD